MKNVSVKARLLIVDDDALLRGMAAKTLQHAGFEVTEASAGDEALLRFQQRPHDLILLDVMMPGIDGYEVCRCIRAMASGGQVPILMLTGLNDAEWIERAFEHGATDLITKPIHWALLSHRVRYALRAAGAAEAMRRSRESLARAQSLAAMGNWTMFRDGRMECSVELMRLLFGDPDFAHSMSADQFLSFVTKADRERVGNARARVMLDGAAYQIEFQIERFDGAIRTIFEQAEAASDSPSVGAVEGISQDITDRVRAQERIRELAHFDATTGLPNRQFFAQLAGPSLDRAARNGKGCAVMSIDLDRFSGVNDVFGRSQGDNLLKTVAERLRLWIRGSDLASVGEKPMDHGVLASGGGNAFTLLIADLTSQEEASTVAQRLLRCLAEPLVVEHQSLVLSACIGIAFFPSDASDFEGLSRCADQAIHAAQQAGRAQCRFFDERMNVDAAARLTLEAELRHAIATDELRLYFQPKVDALTGTIVGAEALVRWQHSARGLLFPSEFINLAEETGLITPLTAWVLESACRYLREWSEAGLRVPRLSVNLASSNLTDSTLVDLGDRLERYGLAPTCFMLEMTETMLMRDAQVARPLLEALRAQGYGLSLDDFGTGYSSLSHLQRLPVDELKIDRAFVTDVERGGRDAALAAAIIALARELGLTVVAEGVETQAQSDFLLKRGCRIQQGYLFAKPVTAQEFVRMMRAGSTAPADTVTT